MNEVPTPVKAGLKGLNEIVTFVKVCLKGVIEVATLVKVGLKGGNEVAILVKVGLKGVRAYFGRFPTSPPATARATPPPSNVDFKIVGNAGLKDVNEFAFSVKVKYSS